jgi:anti-anti-sigma regulatory factor
MVSESTGEAALAHAPTVIVLPSEIDLTNAGQAYQPVLAALRSGAAVIVADFSATVFCDVAGFRALAALAGEAADRRAELWLVIPPGTALARLLDLLDTLSPAQRARISPRRVWLGETP